MSGFPCPWCGTGIGPHGDEGRLPDACPRCHHGLVVEYRYRLHSHLAAGPVVSVYEAVAEPLGERVAVVFLVPDDEVWRRRFLAGYHVFGRIHHRGIARVHEMSSASSPRLYAVVEWVGVSLEQRVQQDGVMSAEQVATMLEVLLGGLSDAHRNRPPVLHGAIHPRRIGFREAGRPALVGFEYALEVSASDPLPTHYAPGYQAPELAQGMIGPAADVYALGTAAMFAASGLGPDRPLADRATALQALPSGLAALLSHMTHADPAQRLPDATRALGELTAILDGFAPVARHRVDHRIHGDVDEGDEPYEPPWEFQPSEPVAPMPVPRARPTASVQSGGKRARKVVLFMVLTPVALGMCGVCIGLASEDEDEAAPVQRGVPAPVVPPQATPPAPLEAEPPTPAPAPALEFEDILVQEFTVTRVKGSAPAARGDECTVQVHPVGGSEFNCRVFVDCRSQRIYGDAEAGFNRCSLEAGVPVGARDEASNDGDPALAMDLSANQVVVSSDLPDATWRVELDGRPTGEGQ